MGLRWFRGGPESPPLDAEPRRDEGEARASSFENTQNIKHWQPEQVPI